MAWTLRGGKRVIKGRPLRKEYGKKNILYLRWHSSVNVNFLCRSAKFCLITGLLKHLLINMAHIVKKLSNSVFGYFKTKKTSPASGKKASNEGLILNYFLHN